MTLRGLINADTTILIILKSLEALETLNDLTLNLNLILVLDLKPLKAEKMIKITATTIVKRICIMKLYRLNEDIIKLFDDIKVNDDIGTMI